MSTRKRLYVTIMVLAASALAVDQFVLSDPVTGPNVAAASVGAITTTGAETPTSGPAGMAFIPKLPFPHEVSRFTFNDEMPDLFSPPATGDNGPGSGGGSDNAGGTSARPGALDRKTFEQHHGLTGIITQPRLKIAIVDGAWMRIGESLDGCELTDITGKHVRFECFDGKATIAFTHETKP